MTSQVFVSVLCFILLSCSPSRPRSASNDDGRFKEQPVEEENPDDPNSENAQFGNPSETTTGTIVGNGKNQEPSMGSKQKGDAIPSPQPSPAPGGGEGSMTPIMPVPNSNKLVFKPLGQTPGGYQKIKEARFPDHCVKGDLVPTTGALFPFNESQTLVVRGPLVLKNLSVFAKKNGNWLRIGSLEDLQWKENNYGTIKNLGKYPKIDAQLENGREIFTQLPEAGEKMIVANAKMPHQDGNLYNQTAQNNVPAIWILNSRIFEAPSGQYFCNCRGLGNPGGCGEIDIAEIIPENKNEVTSTLYSYEGARGGIFKSPRPVANYQVWAAILQVNNGVGEASILEADRFDFDASTWSDNFVSKQWLGSAKSLNAGAERLNKP